MVWEQVDGFLTCTSTHQILYDKMTTVLYHDPGIIMTVSLQPVKSMTADTGNFKLTNSDISSPSSRFIGLVDQDHC